MSQDTSTGAQTPARPVVKLTVGILALAVLAALPELVMTNVVVWLAVVAAVWAFGTLLHAALWGYGILAVIIGGTGLWATVQTLRLAVRNLAAPDGSGDSPA